MSVLRNHHKQLTDGVGKCSVPMWCNGMPSGFCDSDAYGTPVPGQRRYNGYVPALACPAHGGPDKPDVIYSQDGNMRCAVRHSFVNLQESSAGFGSTNAEALADLEREEALAKSKKARGR